MFCPFRYEVFQPPSAGVAGRFTPDVVYVPPLTFMMMDSA